MIELTFLKELMLVKKENQKSEMFVVFFKNFKFQSNVRNRCHDFLMMSMNLSDVAILSIKDYNYRCIISGINKSEVIHLMQNTSLAKKSRH